MLWMTEQGYESQSCVHALEIFSLSFSVSLLIFTACKSDKDFCSFWNVSKDSNLQCRESPVLWLGWIQDKQLNTVGKKKRHIFQELHFVAFKLSWSSRPSMTTVKTLSSSTLIPLLFPFLICRCRLAFFIIAAMELQRGDKMNLLKLKEVNCKSKKGASL